MIPRPDPESGQVMGQPVGPLLEFGVGDLPIAAATATRSPKASAACSKRSAKFRAMGTKVERVTVLGKPSGYLEWEPQP